MSRLPLVATLAVLVGAVVAAAPQAAPFDILIVNGRVLDGSGNPWMRQDIGVRGDRIVVVPPG